MGNETQDVENDDRLSELLEQGIEIPDDPIAIEALLEQQSAKPAATPDPDQGKDGKDGKTADEPNPDDEAAKAAAAAEAEKAKSKQDPPADQPNPDDDGKGPPPAVLRATRESLHKAENLLSERDKELAAERKRAEDLERQIAELREKSGKTQEELQAAADEATGGKKVELATLDKKALETLRRDMDDATVDFLEALVEQHEAVKAELTQLKKASDGIVATHQRTEAEQQQDDIDSVPLLAVLSATRSVEADALWSLASAYEKSIVKDDAFKGKSQREIYQEVGKRLETFLGAEATTKWVGPAKPNGSGKARDEVVEDKLAKARERAAPHSLSDLPAGKPAAQSELERLDGMSTDDIEAYLDKALARGQDAYEEALARLSTAER